MAELKVIILYPEQGVCPPFKRKIDGFPSVQFIMQALNVIKARLQKSL